MSQPSLPVSLRVPLPEGTATYEDAFRLELPRVHAAQRGDPDALNWAAQVTRQPCSVVAGKFVPPTHHLFPDLVQQGWLGVHRAIERYQSSYGIRLVDAAVPHIYDFISKYWCAANGTVRLPRNYHSIRSKLVKARPDLTNSPEQLGQALTELGLSPDLAMQVARLHAGTVSLSEPAAPINFARSMVCSQLTPTEHIEQAEMSDLCRRAIDRCDAELQNAIRETYWPQTRAEPTLGDQTTSSLRKIRKSRRALLNQALTAIKAEIEKPPTPHYRTLVKAIAWESDIRR